MREIEYNLSHEKGAYLMVFNFVMLLMFMMILFLIGFIRSGILRWVVSIFAMGILATFFAKTIYLYSIPMKSWKRETDLNLLVGSNLEPLSKTFDRAAHGSETSQALLEERLKKLFIQRLKDSRELTSDDVNELLEDPKRLKRVVGDKVLVDFLIKGKDIRKVGGHHAIYGAPIEADPKKYKMKINRIIKHIEEWK